MSCRFPRNSYLAPLKIREFRNVTAGTLHERMREKERKPGKQYETFRKLEPSARYPRNVQRSKSASLRRMYMHVFIKSILNSTLQYRIFREISILLLDYGNCALHCIAKIEDTIFLLLLSFSFCFSRTFGNKMSGTTIAGFVPFLFS